MKKNIVRFQVAALVAALVTALSAVSCPLDTGDVGTYYVAYDANGGTGTMANSAFTVGVPGNLRKNTFTRTGYGFGGWAKTAGGEAAYTDGEGVTDLTGKDTTVTLYAVWSVDTDITISGVSVKFRRVPAGSFQRDSDPGNISVITKDYWMSETEVTQELFEAVMGTNPSSFTSGADASEVQGKRPVESVSWYDAIAFCNKLSLADGKEPVYSVSGVTDWSTLAYNSIPTSDDGTWDAVTMDTSKNGYRLPTEMEWEWAAMGADRTSQPNTSGYKKDFAGDNGSNSVDSYAWYGNNSSSMTHEVGKKNANELGLYDMSGNVWEWCWDWYSEPAGTQTDYTGPASGSYRVIRGGAWNSVASFVGPAYRFNTYPSNRVIVLGFRLVRP